MCVQVREAVTDYEQRLAQDFNALKKEKKERKLSTKLSQDAGTKRKSARKVGGNFVHDMLLWQSL